MMSIWSGRLSKSSKDKLDAQAEAPGEGLLAMEVKDFRLCVIQLVQKL